MDWLLWHHHDHTTSPLWCATKWRHNKITWRFSRDRYFETLLWSHHEGYFVKNHQMTSFWCSLETRSKKSIMMNLQWTLQVKITWEPMCNLILKSPGGSSQKKVTIVSQRIHQIMDTWEWNWDGWKISYFISQCTVKINL